MYLQVHRRERLVGLKRARKSHSHRGIGKTAEYPALKRSHRIRVLRSGLQRSHRSPFANLRDADAKQLFDWHARSSNFFNERVAGVWRIGGIHDSCSLFLGTLFGEASAKYSIFQGDA
ncbi:MAG: hypothetical protein WA766_14360 [Candidatus Acidiferrales bacterium]